MVGAGALGCEYLDNFALIGILAYENNENKVTITDNDNIELSNLSRQFLFRNSDIGKSKSLCACRESIKINKNFNCLNLNYLVNNSTTNIFNDDFWEKQNLIITAVDNLQARKFVDKKCTFYSLALIDAGTNGTNASSDIFYPGKTICLNDLPEPTETKIPLCTLKKFPTQINHCIHWAKEIFKELFEEGINELKTFINDKNKFISIFKNSLANNEFYLKIKKIKYFIRIFDNTNDSNIIEFAMFLLYIILIYLLIYF
jgi:ubiquitin-activating enzyme E1